MPRPSARDPGVVAHHRGNGGKLVVQPGLRRPRPPPSHGQRKERRVTRRQARDADAGGSGAGEEEEGGGGGFDLKFAVAAAGALCGVLILFGALLPMAHGAMASSVQGGTA